MKQKAQNLINNSKAIIFDLDGVIINSTPFWRESKLLFLAKRGITDMNKIDAIGRLIGMGGKEVMQIYQKHFGLKGSLEDLFIEWSNISYELFMAAKEDLLDGALDFITHIDIIHKKPLAIATGGYVPERVKIILQQHKLHEYFTHIVSSSQVEKGKTAS